MSSSIADHRRRLGTFGEEVAAGFLERHGVRVLARNVTVGRGEIDLIGIEEGRRLAIEVKTAMVGGSREGGHPRDHFTDKKAEQVRGLARRVSISRVDLVTVTVGRSGVIVDWHRRVA